MATLPRGVHDFLTFLGGALGWSSWTLVVEKKTGEVTDVMAASSAGRERLPMIFAGPEGVQLVVLSEPEGPSDVALIEAIFALAASRVPPA